MSKKSAKKHIEEVEVDEVETDAVDDGVAAEGKKGGKRIVLNVKGKEIARTDYIRQRWSEKASRGQIAKELTALQGKPVAYQIVFAATKGLEGGPDKTAETEEAAED